MVTILDDMEVHLLRHIPNHDVVDTAVDANAILNISDVGSGDAANLLDAIL